MKQYVVYDNTVLSVVSNLELNEFKEIVENIVYE